jgi:hypothetical protein
MAITPDKFKAGLAVMASANGTWANRVNQPTATKSGSVGKVLKQYNKGTKIGILSGAVFKYVVNGKTFNYLEVILESPIKPNYFTTYYRAVVKDENLEVFAEKITPKLPAKVVTTAKKKASTSVSKNTGTTPVKVNTDTNVNTDDYYQYVPESETNDVVKYVGYGLLFVGLGLLSNYLYKRSKNGK